jgi:hypothetical protein
MGRLFIVAVGFAASLGVAGFAHAQSRNGYPVPPATASTPGPYPIISGDPDPALHDLGSDTLIYDLRGGKMVNCGAAGIPAAGSVGSPAPSHPCR